MPLCMGLCGSSSVSQRAWCLRWMATHSLVIIEVVSQPQNLKKCASTGWKSTPRWVWLRCRYSVTVKMVSWVTTRKNAKRPQKPDWTRPPARKSSREAGMAWEYSGGGVRLQSWELRGSIATLRWRMARLRFTFASGVRLAREPGRPHAAAMPELPEVETTRRGLAPHLEGARVQRVLLRRPDLRWPIPPEVGERLPGQRIDAVRRRAKYLLLDTAAGSALLHLGMSGSLRVLPADTPAAL